MTKPTQKQIIAAYGESWAELSENLQECALRKEGWIPENHMPHGIQCDYMEDMSIPEAYARPAAIYNNGWTKIEKDGSNLPGEGDMGFYDCFISNTGAVISRRECYLVRGFWKFYGITHYKKYEPLKPPIV